MSDETYLDELQEYMNHDYELDGDDWDRYYELCNFFAYDVFHLDANLLYAIKQAILQKIEQEKDERKQ